MEQQQNSEGEKILIRDKIKNNPELSATDQKDFPTNVEILSKGVSDIVAFQREFKDLGENINAFDDVFLGISPERGCITGTILSGLPDKKRQKIISFLEERDYLVTDLTEHDGKKQKRSLVGRMRDKFSTKRKRFSVINLLAAQKVIRLDLERGDNIFPAYHVYIDNLQALKSWFSSFPRDWMIGEYSHSKSNERLGLLSGYPIRSVLEYKQIHKARLHFAEEAIKLGLNKDKVQTVIDLRILDRNEIYQEFLQNPSLTPELKEELSFFMKGFAGEDFLATSKEDALWRENLIALKEKVYALFADKISKPKSI